MSLFDPAEAVSLFVEAYAHLESAVLPGTRVEQINGLTALHFSHPDGGIAYEFIAHDLPAAEVAARIRAGAPGISHLLTVFTCQPAEQAAALAGLGYALSHREALMARSLPPEALSAPDARVQRVGDPATLMKLNRARGFQVHHESQLSDPLTRIYALAQAGKVVAWGALHWVRPDTVYIANMYTLTRYRRQGLGSAVLATLLADAAQAGARRCLLVSSQVGYALYARAGFADLLACLVFRSPP